jgi:hypothetical protein
VPSYILSLVSIFTVRRIRRFIVRHRFERIINGRSYLIEVTWVAEKRWRAGIVKMPGIPTAMMPFYGETPDQAATNLTAWLDRAHQHQASTV